MILLHFLEEAVPGLALGLLLSHGASNDRPPARCIIRRPRGPPAPAYRVVSGERTAWAICCPRFLSIRRERREGEDASEEDAASLLLSISHSALFSLSPIKYKARIPAARENSSMILASSRRSGVVDFSIFGRRLDVIDRCDLPRLCSALLRNQTSPPLARASIARRYDDITLSLT